MKPVTIKDIAKKAGVSYASVSRALNNSPKISQETKERILTICKEEGYRVNTLARNLSRRKTNVIGLILPDLDNPFFSEILLHVVTHSRELGYSVMSSFSFNSPSRTCEQIESLLSQQVDGLIIACSDNTITSLIKDYSSFLPILLIDSSLDKQEFGRFNIVDADNLAGGQAAARYLLSLGHRRVAYLGHRRCSSPHQHRHEGFSEIMKQAGLNFITVENSDQRSSIEAGYQVGMDFFSQQTDTTAVFAASDSIAIGVMKAADQLGIRIPEDISLLGYDNIAYSSLPRIELTTIDQRKHEQGKAAVEMLVKLIEQKEQKETVIRLFQPSIIERLTCRAI